MDIATTIRWRLTKRKGTLATFPGQRVSAASAGTMVAASIRKANRWKIVRQELRSRAEIRLAKSRHLKRDIDSLLSRGGWVECRRVLQHCRDGAQTNF